MTDFFSPQQNPLVKRVRSWLKGLRFRHFIWLTPLVVLGCFLGVLFATQALRFAPNLTRESPLLSTLWPLAGLAVILSLYWRREKLRPRLCVAVAVILVMSTLAAKRVLPAANDVSQLAQTPTKRPNQRVRVALEGWVAAIPQRGDFGIEFPFECASATLKEYSHAPAPFATSGRVWIRAPLDADIEVGDALTLQAELAELSSAGNPGEKERRWRYLLKNCWCIGIVKETTNIQLVRRADRYPLARFIAATRLAILQHYETAFVAAQRIYPGTTAQLLTAMVFGEGGLREPLPLQTRNEFRIAGLSHILVASGSQVQRTVINHNYCNIGMIMVIDESNQHPFSHLKTAYC